jgi:protein-S-isoprenylcysteine O-methyltransferase Ste14
MDRRELKRAALLRFGGGVLVLGGIFFGSAGTLRYWEGWVFMAVLFVPVALVVAYLLRHDPELLERRLKAREERPRQTAITSMAAAAWLVGFVVPGFDHRLGWSTVPIPVVVLADVLVLAGYLIFFLTLRENRFASRVIRVEADQVVITSGPYAVVRHPMYLGVSLMLLFAPLALGSWWAMIPTGLTPFFLVLRIRDEEEALLEELPGYGEYTQQTVHRLIPGVW